MNIQAHYEKKEVISEIFRFSKDRWLAFLTKEGRFKRYFALKVPLKAESEDHLHSLIKEFKPRTIYATANLYRILNKYEDINLENVYACTPTLDIDNRIEEWRITIKLVKEILYLLDKYNVRKSIIIKWSGNGCHIHLNHKAFSKDILKKYNALDIAYSIVEFLIRKTEFIVFEFRKLSKELIIENRMDPKRLFTCPLSLHRNLDLACVCIDPNRIDDFEIGWLIPEKYVHYSNWDDFIKGELDDLAIIAYEQIGPRKQKRKRKYPPVDEEIRKTLEKYRDEI